MGHDKSGVVGAHLSFKEIARAWSKVAGDSPDKLMEALVRDFWLGEFEGEGQSVLFASLPPLSASPERRPGNYAVRAGGLVVKVGEDLESYITHKRRESAILREGVAYVHCRPEWRGITAEHPAGFIKWSDEKRDARRPNWRTEYDEGYRALATVLFGLWSSDMREDHYAQWRIRRHHFADWYNGSHLSAGAPLTSFWPGVDKQFIGPTAPNRVVADGPQAVGSVGTGEPDTPPLKRGMRLFFEAIKAESKARGQTRWVDDVRPQERNSAIEKRLLNLRYRKVINRESFDRRLRYFFREHWPSLRGQLEADIQADIPDKTG